jgi:tetratricopeptide (TPR) repeat protein
MERSMPIEIIRAEEAFERIRKNINRTHPRYDRDENRLVPFPTIEIKPSFQFDSECTFFATGSCFARNIENALKTISANVSSSPLDIRVPEGANVFQLYNKYTVHGILNELEWALTDRTFDPELHLLETGDGQYCDLQISPALRGSLEEMINLRADYNNSFKNAARADVVIVTMGLVECWFDTKAEIYLNLAPSPALVKRHPDRFEFHLLGYDDVLKALKRIYTLIENSNEIAPRFLVTVSPVALQSTFREQDVLIANSYSKSVQRAVIDQFISEHKADYFPSFEMVTLADNELAWTKKDFRHVNQAAVQRIMATVFSSYSGVSKGQQKLEALGRAEAFNAKAMYDQEFEALSVYTEGYGGEDVEVIGQLADAYYAAGEYEEAVKTLTGLLENASVDPDLFPKAKIRNITSRLNRAKKLQALSSNQSSANKPLSREQKARQLIEKLSFTMPKNADIQWLRQHFQRAETHRALAQEFVSAGGDPSLFTTLETLEGLDDPLPLVDALGNALDDAPESDYLKLNLAEALITFDENNTAITLLKQLIDGAGTGADYAQTLFRQL